MGEKMKLSKIFLDVKLQEINRVKERVHKTRHLFKCFILGLLVFAILLSTTPSAKAYSYWVKDTTDSEGDHVVAVAYKQMPQKDPEHARAFIKMSVKYRSELHWWGILYIIPTDVDLRIYYDNDLDYLYTSSDGSGHKCISDVWSNPKDAHYIGGHSVGIGHWSITLPSFYSVDNIMLHPRNHGHWSYGGDVKWYFINYDLTSVIDSWMGSEKWFGGEQGYYFMGGEGHDVLLHFHAAVYYYESPQSWIPGYIPKTNSHWASKNIYATSEAGIKIAGEN
ncbi:MAG: hypothetical protein J7K57_07030 [Palaeococcus sp.]|uniref:hypothetical protein n=1 Tax=Palaeococcus sp. (in: euryarchaeotes) TaxID=2820298 RepID=UPI0025DD7D38|nr:hypothetical protein [Palaeococcus sp. (in: euryarchaeotes)]MCD6559602.1 hypothetical protein [Palaeococcus sp. (in: euryarchaeotes)]